MKSCAQVLAVLTLVSAAITGCSILSPKEELVMQPANQEQARIALRQRGIPVTYEALHDAALRSQVTRVHWLLLAGVDPNARSTTRPGTVLGAATRIQCNTHSTPDDPTSRDQTIDQLLAAGANPNAMEPGSIPAFVMIAQRCPGKVVAKLIAAGGDLEARSPQGFTPLTMALIVKNFDSARVLIDHGARLSDAAVQRLYPEPPTDLVEAELVTRARTAR